MDGFFLPSISMKKACIGKKWVSLHAPPWKDLSKQGKTNLETSEAVRFHTNLHHHILYDFIKNCIYMCKTYMHTPLGSFISFLAEICGVYTDCCGKIIRVHVGVMFTLGLLLQSLCVFNIVLQRVACRTYLLGILKGLETRETRRIEEGKNMPPD